MKLITRENVVGKRRRVVFPDDVFDREEAVEDSNGTVLCPTCGCCALKEIWGEHWVCLGDVAGPFDTIDCPVSEAYRCVTGMGALGDFRAQIRVPVPQ
jgi:hypothetical protein